MTARAQALGLMLKEEERGEGEEKNGGARRLREMTAVVAEWQRWQALEVEVCVARCGRGATRLESLVDLGSHPRPAVCHPTGAVVHR